MNSIAIADSSSPMIRTEYRFLSGRSRSNRDGRRKSKPDDNPDQEDTDQHECPVHWVRNMIRKDDHGADRSGPCQQRNRKRHYGDVVLGLSFLCLLGRMLPSGCCAFSIEMAIRRIKIPPPTRNDAMLIPNTCRKPSPNTLDIISRMNTAIAVVLATRRRSGTGISWVIPTNTGITPIGFSIARSAVKNFRYSV